MSSTAFGPPFDHADADTILRSSDQVDFPVYRVILSASSSFFKSMFSLPQPEASVLEKQKPVIDLTENSRTISIILTLIYPVVSVATEPESLDDMIDACVAAKKYDMAAVSRRLIQMFTESDIVRDKPVVAFCAAYSHELGEAARVAARASLKRRMNLDNLGDMLQHINGPAFHQLYKFHRACSNTASEVVSGAHLTWITTGHYTWWSLANKGCTYACPKYHYTIGPSRSAWEIPAPYHDYITRAHKVLLEHPCKEAVTPNYFLYPSYGQKGCSQCQLSAFGLPEFSYLLGEEVERRVSEVDLVLPF
ncbi:hypothetical protein EDB92DRAFT_1831068 [Lactarius akahatsu]|uniref:BTB domain-containing protein n=1 Tax=Lactarius akahatsu TaxID=416441 RepID=A0AAD4LSA7_9AGAM|nr:hypothetical protein EDB92DRAFT_1831068 [Lactarius akahatsu]